MRLSTVCMGAILRDLLKIKKRAVRKRAKSVAVENGEVFIKRRKSKVSSLCTTTSSNASSVHLEYFVGEAYHE